MKVFVAHLIVMGILKKNSLEQYWSRDSILNMPFFGYYMSRNCFQNILWNLVANERHRVRIPPGEIPFSASRVFKKNLIISITKTLENHLYLDDGRPSGQMRGTDAQW